VELRKYHVSDFCPVILRLYAEQTHQPDEIAAFGRRSPIDACIAFDLFHDQRQVRLRLFEVFRERPWNEAHDFRIGTQSENAVCVGLFGFPEHEPVGFQYGERIEVQLKHIQNIIEITEDFLGWKKYFYTFITPNLKNNLLMCPFETIEKETIHGLKFPSGDVLDNREDMTQRKSELQRALTLGNLEHGKTRILFEDNQSKKVVETTVWGVTDDYVILKRGAGIPINRIYWSR
jgi:hypothetical protein